MYELVFRLLALRKLHVITVQYGYKWDFDDNLQLKIAILNFKRYARFLR